MDGGRFERLEEPAGEAQGDHVLVPNLGSVPGRKAQPVGLGERLAVEIGEQQVDRLIVTDVFGAIDMTVTDAVLQRDAPLPAGLARC